MCDGKCSVLALFSEKFKHAAKAVRLSDNRTITLARFLTLEDAVRWFGKWEQEYKKEKWGFRELWVE